MANHRIPLTAERIEALAAATDDGRIARTHVYRHTRSGHTRPEFYLVQYAEHPNGGSTGPPGGPGSSPAPPAPPG